MIIECSALIGSLHSHWEKERKEMDEAEDERGKWAVKHCLLDMMYSRCHPELTVALVTCTRT